MEYRFLEHQYYEMRRHQMKMNGREYSAIDETVSKIIFDTSLQAVKNVSTASKNVCMQAVPLGTGLGKSTSTYALIATLAKHGKSFSAAYVTPTIMMAMDAQEGIERLLGPNTTTLWSSHHKHEGVDRKQAMKDLGFVPTRTVNKADLQSSRIVIVTHSQLKWEMQCGYDEGCMKFQGSPRSIVFIDEHPDLVQVLRATGTQLQAFHDELVKLKPDHSWLPVISQVTQRMNAMARSNGQTYSPAYLLSPEQGKVFNDDEGLRLWELTDEAVTSEKRLSQLQAMKKMVAFLQVASKGQVFYSRQDHGFHTYQLDLTTDYPGFVLLDATCNLTGLIGLHPRIRVVDVLPVNHENLNLHSIDLPAKFRTISEVLSDQAIGREYGQFIIQSVLANTFEGDNVLVVTHKDVMTKEFIGSSVDPRNPLDWEGRKVNTLNWGAGVGQNKFRNKTHVFLFGDYHLPRAANIAQTHAWSQRPLTEALLAGATGKRKAGTIYTPNGQYLRTHDGHLLSWTKQLAMRGTARQVDADGKCYSMQLFTTIDPVNLLPNLYRLFPGVNPPVPAKLPEGTNGTPLQGRHGLVRLLMSTTNRPWLSASEIEVITDIPTSKLSTEFKAIEETVDSLGWRLASAKDLNIAGREKYLVHDQRFAQSLLQAA